MYFFTEGFIRDYRSLTQGKVRLKKEHAVLPAACVVESMYIYILNAFMPLRFMSKVAHRLDFLRAQD